MGSPGLCDLMNQKVNNIAIGDRETEFLEGAGESRFQNPITLVLPNNWKEVKTTFTLKQIPLN